MSGTAETLAGLIEPSAVLGSAQTIEGAIVARTDAPVIPEPGAFIGRYMALHRLGAGAMGVVFAAYDPKLDRKLAIKILRPRADSRDDAKRRLEREAQALAKLGHPNVVAVHDVGEHQGQVFVAMEFVAGQTLREWMEHSDGPRPWPEVLRVFEAAGRGLAAAHVTGLMHRDFKPDNVMIGDDGRVRVMDFGLARAASAQTVSEVSRAVAELDLQKVGADAGQLVKSLTRTGAMMGTPAYMAPEQFAGQADAASDQFGFCVTLYEALYGGRPFAGDTVAELVGAVCSGRVDDPPSGTVVPGWVHRVVVRGLATEPAERYPTMDALLTALADDPSSRRRRWMMGAAVVALAGVGLWGGLTRVRGEAPGPAPCSGFEAKLEGIWDDGRRAQIEQALRGTGLTYAPVTWEKIEPRLSAYGRDWVAMRTEACQATQRGEQSGERLDLRMGCLDRHLVRLDAVVELLGKADAQVTENAVEVVAALPPLSRCADASVLEAEGPPPEDPRIADRVAALEYQVARADALGIAGKYQDGVETMERLVAEVEVLGHSPLSARYWLTKAKLHMYLGDYDDAVAMLQGSFDLALGERMLNEAALSAIRLAEVFSSDAERIEHSDVWISVAEPLVRATQNDWLLYLLTECRGILAFKGGHYEQAREAHERALELVSARFGDDSPRVALSLGNLANAVRAIGNDDEALALQKRVLQVLENGLGPTHPDVGVVLFNLGNILRSMGEPAAAREHLERARDVITAAIGADAPQLQAIISSLGNVAWAEGDYAKAEALYRRALELQEAASGPRHRMVAMILNNLGVVAAKQRDWERARGYYERALDIRESVLGPEHPEVAVSVSNLGVLTYRQGDFSAARELHERALKIREAALAPEHPEIAVSATELALALLELDQDLEALPLLQRSLAIREAANQPPSKQAETWFALARVLWSLPPKEGRDRARARMLARRAEMAFQESDAQEDVEQVRAWRAEHDPESSGEADASVIEDREAEVEPGGTVVGGR